MCKHEWHFVERTPAMGKNGVAFWNEFVCRLCGEIEIVGTEVKEQ